MILRIGTLNLWGFKEWEDRKELIIETIKKLDLDLIVFQQVTFNQVLYDKTNLDIINEDLRFKYKGFYKNNEMGTEANGDYKSVGLGYLSNLKIGNFFEYVLEKTEGEKGFRSINYFEAQKGNELIGICNLHFANDNINSIRNLRETTKLLEERKLNPILLGDFNISNLEKSDEVRNFSVSTEFRNYISYPEDNTTYDYILIPKKYSFSSIEAIGGLSDHKMVMAKLEM